MECDHLVIDAPSYARTEARPEGERVLWLASGDREGSISAHRVAERCNAQMRQPHFILDPSTEGATQMIPVDRKNNLYPPDHPGASMVAVLVVAPGPIDVVHHLDPPSYHLAECLGVPTAWPMGPPTPGLVIPTRPDYPPGHYTPEQIGISE